MTPTSGEIRHDGEQFFRGNIAVRRRLAYLPDFPIAFPNNTVPRHIGMVLRPYGIDGSSAEAQVMKLLRGFDLMPLIDTPMAQLSRGQAGFSGRLFVNSTGIPSVVSEHPQSTCAQRPQTEVVEIATSICTGFYVAVLRAAVTQSLDGRDSVESKIKETENGAAALF